MTFASLCLSRVIRSESMITLNVVTRADDERSTGPTHCHCQCCLCETALEGRIREIPTPMSILRHSRMHGINNTSSTVNRHASLLHEHAFSSPSHVSCAAVYFNTWAQKVNLAGSAFMVDGTSRKQRRHVWMRTHYERSNGILRASQLLRWRIQSRSENPCIPCHY